MTESVNVIEIFDSAYDEDARTRLDAIEAVEITGGGLATGGGDLTASRTITVAKASGAEAAAGVIDTKALTPLALATPLATINAAQAAEEAAREAADAAIAADLTAHEGASNPHGLTAADIGLGAVDDTADADKPVSTATAAALALKAPLASPALTGTPTAPTAAAGTDTTQIATTAYAKAAADAIASGLAAHEAATANPHAVTKAQLGLGNVDNTADVDKPVSTATQAAINAAQADVDSATSDLAAHVADTDNPHVVTKTQVGLGAVDNTADADKPVSAAQQIAINTVQAASDTIAADLAAHETQTDNPHVVTKTQVGLGSVDNTADIDKPVSAATQTALNTLDSAVDAVAADLATHEARVDNPHTVTKAQVGLGNVDNTSDLNKPVSTATQAAINVVQIDADAALALKAPLASPALTGTPTAPTAAAGTDTTQIATTAYAKAAADAIASGLAAHEADTANPHAVTKAQLGLGNVADLAPADLPVSTAAQAAIDAVQADADAALAELQQLPSELLPYCVKRAFGAVGNGATDDTAAIIAAVAYCYDNDVGPVMWPPGVYVTTASIPHFHEVNHEGEGVIKRGVDLFYITPHDDDTNIIYAAIAAAADGNDGLSASEPMLTFQDAIDALEHWGPYLDGIWAIQLTNETFAQGRFRDSGIRSSHPIEIRGFDIGGHPNVPTTKITEGNGTVGVGTRFENRTDIKVSNILFTGYNGSSASAGIYGAYHCNIFTENCHFHECAWGVRGTDWSTLNIKGGIFDTCGYGPDLVTPYSTAGGIQALFHTKMEIGTQNAGNLDSGPIINNSHIAVMGQENSTGHVDWVTIDSCEFGVRMAISSRANVDGVAVSRTATAFYQQDNSVITPSSNTLANLGTGANKNDTVFQTNTGGTISTAGMGFLTGFSSSSTKRCLVRDATNVIVNSTVSQTTVASVTLKGNMFQSTHTPQNQVKSVTAKCWGVMAGTNDVKSVVFGFGAQDANIDFGAGETGSFWAEGVCLLGDNPFGQQMLAARGAIHSGVNHVSAVRPAESMTEDTIWRIAAVVGNALDSIEIWGYEIYIDGL